MNLTLFLSSVLFTLTVQTTTVETTAWQPSQPVQVQSENPSDEPAKLEPIETAEAASNDDAHSNPSPLPMILQEKPSQETPQEEPTPLEGPLLTPPQKMPVEPQPMTEMPTAATPPAPEVLPQKAPSAEVTPPTDIWKTPKEEVTRTSHEVTVPQEQPISSEDLEALIQNSVAMPQQDSRISGRPVRLLDVLSASPVMPQPTQAQFYNRQGLPAPLPSQRFFKNPREEQQRVNAYWELAQSLGQYNLAQEMIRFWDSVATRPGDEALLRTARSSAKASLCEARVSLVTDQHALAEAAELNTDEGLPLPSDPPHVGTYFTHFDKLFAGKPAPALGRRLDATLPLYREVIESRATSTLSARNAAESLAKEYAVGQCTFAKLSTAVEQWRQEQRVFLRAAHVYNYQICEYVVSVAGLPSDRGTLVTMLIRPTYPVTTPTPVQPISEQPTYPGQMPTMAPTHRDPAVQPASANLPILRYVPQTAPAPQRRNTFRLFPR
ncbi:MAG: hypothetical protein PVH19_03310 [Planctomycetia bacterium]|jgi:hypothetical protein